MRRVFGESPMLQLALGSWVAFCSSVTCTSSCKPCANYRDFRKKSRIHVYLHFYELIRQEKREDRRRRGLLLRAASSPRSSARPLASPGGAERSPHPSPLPLRENILSALNKRRKEAAGRRQRGSAFGHLRVLEEARRPQRRVDRRVAERGAPSEKRGEKHRRLRPVYRTRIETDLLIIAEAEQRSRAELFSGARREHVEVPKNLHQLIEGGSCGAAGACGLLERMAAETQIGTSALWAFPAVAYPYTSLLGPRLCSPCSCLWMSGWPGAGARGLRS